MKKILLTIILVTLVIFGLFGYEYTVSGTAKHINYANFVCMVPSEIYIVFTNQNNDIREEIVYANVNDQYSLTITDHIEYNLVTASFAHKTESASIVPNGQVYRQINQITSITNEQRIKDYDRHVSAVIKYDNRIISQKESGIVEYLIIPDGYLEQISYHEIVASTNTAYVDEGRYYSFVNDRHRGVKQMLVFDLSQIPMQLITSIDLHLHAESPAFVLFDDEIMMISNNISHRIEIYNKYNYDYIGFINDYGGAYAAKRENIIMIPYLHDTGIVLKVLNLVFENHYSLIEVSQIYLPDISWIWDLEFQDEKLIISHSNGVLIFEISDDLIPIILYDIYVEQDNYNTRSILYSLYTPENLYASTMHGALLIFNLGDDGQYSLIYDEDFKHNTCRFRNITLDYPFLYMNKERMLQVYDLSSEIEEHIFYGRGITSNIRIPKLNDLYILHNTDLKDSNVTELYSVLNDEVLFIKEFEPRSNNWADIKDNRIFLNVVKEIDNVYHRWIEVYLLNSPEFTLLSSTYIGVSRGNFVLSDNQIFLSDVGTIPNQVVIYDIVDDELIYNTLILGINEGYPRNYEPYLYINNNSNISVKNINYIFQDDLISFDINENYLTHFSHDESTLLMTDITNQMFRIYEYNIQEHSINILNHSIYGIITSSNGVITKNAYGELNTSTYYTIINSELLEIGHKSDSIRNVQRTFFYPYNNKMIQITQSGYYMYDIEYTVSETDNIIKPIKSALIGSYPNPFNPSTTIKYSLSSPSYLQMDIYNIKGQKVKSLVNEYRHAGDHSIIWNGTDENGKDVGSGVYFYRMKAEGYVSTKKMVMMK